MRRRDFIRICTIAGGGIILGLHPEQGECKSIYDAWKLDVNEIEDIRLRCSAMAILAPSSHNTQPWLLKLVDNNRLLLYNDPSRLLPEADPHARQTIISHGCFLQALEIAALEYSYKLNIKLFPNKIFNASHLHHALVADIKFVNEDNLKSSPHFDYLKKRSTNKRIYSDIEIPESNLKMIINSVKSDGMRLQLIKSENEKAKISRYLADAMSIEMSCEKRNRELVEWFRFRSKEIDSKLDGFNVEAAGVTGFKKWIAESFFLDRESSISPRSSFASSGVKQAAQQAESAGAFALLITATNSLTDQITAGKNFIRIHLIATESGLALHPMNQINGGYDEMKELYQNFKSDFNINSGEMVQMIFRLGIAKEVPHMPRRKLESLVI